MVGASLTSNSDERVPVPAKISSRTILCIGSIIDIIDIILIITQTRPSAKRMNF